MQIDGYEFMLDSLTKFFNTIYIKGWFYHPFDELMEVKLVNDTEYITSVSDVGIDYPGFSISSNKGFYCQILRTNSQFPDLAEIEFKTKKGWLKRINILNLAADRVNRYAENSLYNKFRLLLSEYENPKILDIGGRARSKIDHSRDFPGFNYTVLDIHSGDNVDVVGDAHTLSSYFPDESFDAIYSVSVFEHLLMPWQVVLEMNKCLKIGGIALIQTHQTIGMHDLPWDFFRFSNAAWDALFNHRTGFEILDREMSFENYILPFIYRLDQSNAENSAGFELSAVLVRKVNNTTLCWEVQANEIIESSYPLSEDGRDGKRQFNNIF